MFLDRLNAALHRTAQIVSIPVLIIWILAFVTVGLGVLAGIVANPLGVQFVGTLIAVLIANAITIATLVIWSRRRRG